MNAVNMGTNIIGVGLSKEAGTIAGLFKTESSASKPDTAMIVLTTARITQGEDIFTVIQMGTGIIVLLILMQLFMGSHVSIIAIALLVAIHIPGAIRRMEVGITAE